MDVGPALEGASQPRVAPVDSGFVDPRSRSKGALTRGRHWRARLAGGRASKSRRR